MNDSDYSRKYKRPKQKTSATTKPETSTSKLRRPDSEINSSEPLCPLLAKDSEWVDILQTNPNGPNSSTNVSGDEEILQLVECEDGPQMKPLAIMFPGLLDKDPQTLQGMLDRAMSTTEVTRHLVDLGQKANLTFMKKADRLIPKDKQWLESLLENTNLDCSLSFETLGTSTESESEDAVAHKHTLQKAKRRRLKGN